MSAPLVQPLPSWTHVSFRREGQTALHLGVVISGPHADKCAMYLVVDSALVIHLLMRQTMTVVDRNKGSCRFVQWAWTDQLDERARPPVVRVAKVVAQVQAPAPRVNLCPRHKPPKRLHLSAAKRIAFLASFNRA